jgi:hypothetical protein
MNPETEDLRERLTALQREHEDLKETVWNACALLWDYDGYYNTETRKGDPHGLASIIDEAYRLLNGKHWTEPKPDGVAQIKRLEAENRALRTRCEVSEYYWDRADRERKAVRRELEELRTLTGAYNPPYGVGWGKGKDE